jgi:molecular chaperone HscB
MAPTQNFFELFGLPARFSLDGEELERAYRDIQAAVHPDRSAHGAHGADGTEAERRVRMPRATLVNEAYQTLQNPIKRAAYLLELRGIAPQFETAMPTDFLMQQMEWREAIEEASGSADARELDHMSSRLGAELKRLYAEIGVQLDERQDFHAAAETVRKLMFLEKVGHAIGEALEHLDV